MASTTPTTHPPESTKTLATTSPKPSRYRALLAKFSKTSRTQPTTSTSHQKHTSLNAPSQPPRPITPLTILSTTTTPRDLQPTLQSLPTELLHQITTHLTPIDTICLRATNHYFHTSLPSIPPSLLNDCHYWLLACRYERDFISSRGGSITHHDISRLCCAYCKQKRPVKEFTGGNGSAGVVSGLKGMWRKKKPVGSVGRQAQNQGLLQGQQQGQQQQLQIQQQGHGLQQGQPLQQTHPANTKKTCYFPDPHKLLLPPEQRVCAYHFPTVYWVPPCTCSPPNPNHPNHPHKKQRFWLKYMDLTCMHCGSWVEGTHIDGRETGCEKCGCEACPRLPMPCFERFGALRRGVRRGGGVEVLGIWRGRGERLWVWELGDLKPHVIMDAPVCANCAREADEVDAEDGAPASETSSSSSSASSSSSSSSGTNDDDNDHLEDADDATSFYAPDMTELEDDPLDPLASLPPSPLFTS